MIFIFLFLTCFTLYNRLYVHVQLIATLWTAALQAPPSIGFPRQEYWSRLPFLFPADLPDLGIEPISPTFQADSLPLSLHESLEIFFSMHQKCLCFTFILKGYFQWIQCFHLALPFTLLKTSFYCLLLSMLLLRS